MIEAKEAREIALRNIHIQTMLRDLERTVEGCIRNMAANGHMDADIDLSMLAPDTGDPGMKDSVMNAMLSELKMMGYHIDPIENSTMRRINWSEEEGK